VLRSPPRLVRVFGGSHQIFYDRGVTLSGSAGHRALKSADKNRRLKSIINQPRGKIVTLGGGSAAQKPGFTTVP
jgi:hypothetical protein